jgi:hypothetical protein
MRGESLMPCSPRKARLLLKQKKAKIIDYKPFTIHLLYATGETTPKVDMGIELGTKDIEDNYITIPGKAYKQVSFKHIKCAEHQNNWQFISHLFPYGA